MSACPMQNFNGVTSEVWSCLVAQAAQYGVVINTPQGTASKSGFTFTWNYNASSQTVAIQCTDSPTLVPCAVIDSKIQSIATGCGATG
ncbi:MAG TPA: hypothetical protein VF824_00410 [Thermoanaerobaculia bacterium]